MTELNTHLEARELKGGAYRKWSSCRPSCCLEPVEMNEEISNNIYVSYNMTAALLLHISRKTSLAAHPDQKHTDREFQEIEVEKLQSHGADTCTIVSKGWIKEAIEIFYLFCSLIHF